MASERSLPRVAVVVAVLDEAATIADKFRELLAIDYPPALLRLVIVDGGSTDGTREVLREFAAATPRLTTICTQLRSKPGQLNEALAAIDEPWVMVTDADARLPADTLSRFVALAETDASIGAVGATVTPVCAHPLDAALWRVSNRVRQIEHGAGSAGLLVAGGYLFRRTLIDRFPSDTEADDVHITCLAAAAGLRVGLVTTEAQEVRSAATGREWGRHKIRRTRGYLREVFRFVPTIPRMTRVSAVMFLWRGLALTALPLGAIALLAIMMMAGAVGSLSVLLLLTAASAKLRSRTAHASWPARVVAAVALPVWVAAITAGALVTYPFVRARPSYPKVTLRHPVPAVPQ